MNSGKLRLWAFFIVLNLFCGALAYMAHMKGWLWMVVEKDSSQISLYIVGLMLVGLWLCFLSACRINSDFDDLAQGGKERFGKEIEIARVDLSEGMMLLDLRINRKLGWIRRVTSMLPAMGFFGTVFGLLMALDFSEILTDDQTITDVIDQLVGQLMSGIGVAFLTTLVGLIGWFWNTLNLQILEDESSRVMEVFICEAHRDREARQLATASCSPVSAPPSNETGPRAETPPSEGQTPGPESGKEGD